MPSDKYLVSCNKQTGITVHTSLEKAREMAKWLVEAHNGSSAEIFHIQERLVGTYSSKPVFTPANTKD